MRLWHPLFLQHLPMSGPAASTSPPASPAPPTAPAACRTKPGRSPRGGRTSPVQGPPPAPSLLPVPGRFPCSSPHRPQPLRLTLVGEGTIGATGEVREGDGMTGATSGVWAGVLGSLLLISPPEAEAEPEGPAVPLDAAELGVRVGCKTTRAEGSIRGACPGGEGLPRPLCPPHTSFSPAFLSPLRWPIATAVLETPSSTEETQNKTSEVLQALTV